MPTIIESVVKTGNSLAVVIPATFIRRLGIRPKDQVQLQIDLLKGQITYTFTNRRQLPLV
jgi:antitoxin component of MazEF toxin-antitoxin module